MTEEHVDLEERLRLVQENLELVADQVESYDNPEWDDVVSSLRVDARRYQYGRVAVSAIQQIEEGDDGG